MAGDSEPNTIVNFPCGNIGTQMAGWFRQEIKTVADLKGLKFRAGGFGGLVWQRLGVAAQTTYVGAKAWEALPKEYQQAFELACSHAHLDMQAKYDTRNPDALWRLVAQGAIVRPFPREIGALAWKEKNALYAELSASNGEVEEDLRALRQVPRRPGAVGPLRRRQLREPDAVGAQGIGVPRLVGDARHGRVDGLHAGAFSAAAGAVPHRASSCQRSSPSMISWCPRPAGIMG